ncbi:hypothetical protein K1719_000846 [Acacia pycnantha]|nr:hypothetical protein K1719_000846 [Acacia pycnantha]
MHDLHQPHSVPHESSPPHASPPPSTSAMEASRFLWGSVPYLNFLRTRNTKFVLGVLDLLFATIQSRSLTQLYILIFPCTVLI